MSEKEPKVALVDDSILVINEDPSEQTHEITLNDAKAVVEYNYHAPRIHLEEEFKQLEPNKQIKYLHNLASSMNHAAKLLQEERNELLEKVENMKRDIETSEKQFFLQKSINHQLMEKMNETTQENAINLQKEQSRIKQLETIVKAAGLEIN